MRFGHGYSGCTAVLLALLLASATEASAGPAGDGTRHVEAKSATRSPGRVARTHQPNGRHKRADAEIPKVRPLPRPAPPGPPPKRSVRADPAMPLPQPKHDAKPPSSEPKREEAPAAPPGLTEAELQACEVRLSQQDVRFELLPPLSGPDGCGAPEPLRVSVLPSDVSVAAPATLACPVAEALTKWTAEVVIPAADEHLKAKPSTVLIGTSYACRPRNNVAGGKLSEHGLANAVDIMGFRFDGQRVVTVLDQPAPDSPEARFLSEIRAKACTYFKTVLGPGSDAAHASHLHLDLRSRKGDYRMCQ
jgi:hypothetical protein